MPARDTDRRNLVIKMNKKDQRKHLLQIRKLLDSNFVKSSSETICNKLLQMDEYSLSSDIYLYSDMRNEVMTAPVISQAFKDNKNLYLPITIGEDMDFYSYNPGDPLIKGDFGVMVPANGEIKYPASGLIIIPGVGFDKAGYRIGYGKGYYDKYLSKYTGLCKVGVAYECQVTDSIEIDEFDQKLDYLITEQNIYKFN